MDLVILTPYRNRIRPPYAPFFIHVKRNGKRNKIYEVGSFQGETHTYRIAIRLTGPKNANIALAADHAIQTFQPAIIILAGIAGGVKGCKDRRYRGGYQGLWLRIRKRNGRWFCRSSGRRSI